MLGYKRGKKATNSNVEQKPSESKTITEEENTVDPSSRLVDFDDVYTGIVNSDVVAQQQSSAKSEESDVTLENGRESLSTLTNDTNLPNNSRAIPP